ncbi:sporulation delaying protein family toxin [Streptomyces sp. NPDC004031]
MKHHGRIVSIATAVVVTGAAALTTVGSASAASADASNKTVSAKAANAGSAAPGKLSAAEDGRQLFAGIYFGQGPVAAKLASHGVFKGFELSANDSPKAVHAVAGLADRIEAKSPGIFAEFSVKSRSGDPRLVKEATADVSRALAGVSDADLSAPPAASADCVALVVFVAVAAAVAAVVTVAGTGALVVNAAAVINVVVDTKPISSLPQDELMARLATTLRTA